MREYTSVALSPQACGGLLWWLSDTHTVTQLVSGTARTPPVDPAPEPFPRPWPRRTGGPLSSGTKDSSEEGTAEFLMQRLPTGWAVSPVPTEGGSSTAHGKRGALRGVSEDGRNLEGGEHGGQVNGFEGAKAGKRKVRMCKHHTHMRVCADGRWGPRKEGGGHRIWALFSASILHLGLGCTVASPHTVPHPPSSRFKLPAEGPLFLLSPLSSAFPLPHPGSLYKSTGSFRVTRGAQPSGLWDTGCSQATAVFRSSVFPPNGLPPFPPPRPGSNDLPGRCMSCRVPLSRPSGWPGICVPSVVPPAALCMRTAQHSLPGPRTASGCFPHPGRAFPICSGFAGLAPGLA